MNTPDVPGWAWAGADDYAIVRDRVQVGFLYDLTDAWPERTGESVQCTYCMSAGDHRRYSVETLSLQRLPHSIPGKNNLVTRCVAHSATDGARVLRKPMPLHDGIFHERRRLRGAEFALRRELEESAQGLG